MAFTDQQITKLAKQLQQKGAPRQQIVDFVRKAKQEQGRPQAISAGAGVGRPQPQRAPIQARAAAGRGRQIGPTPEGPQFPRIPFVAPPGLKEAGALVGVDVERAGGEFLRGAAKGAAETGIGAAKIVGRNIPGLPGLQVGIDEGRAVRKALRPETTTEEVGRFAEKTAEFLIPAAAGARVAKGAGLGARALAGAAEAAGVTAVQEGEVGKEALLAGAIGGAVPLGAAAVKGVAKPLGAAAAKLRARLSGLKPADISAVKGVSEGERNIFRKMIIEGDKKAASRLTGQDPMRIAGDKLAAFQGKLKDLRRSLGADVRKQVTGARAIKETIDSKPFLSSFKNQLDDLGVTVKQGKLNFVNSDIEGLASDQKLLTFVFDKLKTGKSIKPRDAIALRRNLQNKLKIGKRAGDLTASQNIANDLRVALNESVTKLKGEIGEANKAFTEVAQLDDILTKAIKKEGVKAPEFLGRAFSNTGTLPEETLKAVQKLAKKLNIEEGKNILKIADLGIAARNAVKFVPERSLKGQIPTARGALGTAFEGLVEGLVGTPKQNLLNIVNQESKALRQQAINALDQKALAGILSQLLEAR